LSRSIVHRHLTDSLDFTVRHLLWIRNRPLDDPNTIRINLSRELLRALERQQTRDWHNILTLDESWFYLSICLFVHLYICISVSLSICLQTTSEFGSHPNGWILTENARWRTPLH
jgi:hypothetical protein